MNQMKSCNRGGKREGAGRKKGALTIRTRAVAEKLIASGLTPLESIIKLMRSPQPVCRKMEPWEKYDQRVYQWQQLTFNAAKAAANYCHPRLQAIEHSGPDADRVPVSINMELV